MPFLSGPITFDCYRINASQVSQFGMTQLEILERFAVSQVESYSTEEATCGFLAGDHLFDGNFCLEKNVIGDALHCAVRIDSNRIPAALRKAWLQIELAALSVDSPSGRPTKAQRLEAKETVEARCQEEAQSGKFRKMQQFPVLWDGRHNALYFGGTSPTAAELACDLFGRAFELELERLTAGRRAQEWATQARRRKTLEDAVPSAFLAGGGSDIQWWSAESGNCDFLGNEFLMWLWWRWETQSETISLADGSEVAGMFARTLTLQCPHGESGKETIAAEGPTRLPEAVAAIRSGKLPRKAGLTLVRHGAQYELVLHAETFTVSGARIRTEETAERVEGQGIVEERLDSVRDLEETVSLLFQAFCQQRIGKEWSPELEKIRRWLKSGAASARRQPA